MVRFSIVSEKLYMTSEMVRNLVNRAQLTYILLEVREQSADPGYVMAWLVTFIQSSV